MHSTLKAETARPPRASFRAQQRSFETFRREYNHERPHEALGYDTPASRYEPSRRPYPGQLPPPEYPAHFRVERGYPNGVISFRETQWYLTKARGYRRFGLLVRTDGTVSSRRRRRPR